MNRVRLLPIAASIVVVMVAFTSACSRPDVTLRAPGRIEQALTVANVVNDLGATATLVHKGGSHEPGVKLARGDDGVTFSGFLPTSPGQYTLEVTFDGVITADVATGKGQRHFLGRLTSDSFTVTQGATATPTFTKAIDTVGLAADHGDDDKDGLGFIDELLIGTDPQKDDTDGDGVKDGNDCKPTDSGDRFAILAGGSVDDCDGDGFNSITALLGAKGIDCDDENAAVNPGVHDDCTNTVDEDCNPQTCPVDDSTGPTVELIAPADGSTIGCNAPFVVHATDASDVAGVLLTAVGHPFPGGQDRVLAMNDAHDHLTWNAPDGFGIEGQGLTDGDFPVDVTGRDNRGNPSTIHAHYTMTRAFPSVTMTGSDGIGSDPVDLVVTPTGTRPLATLELRSSPIDVNGALDLSHEITVATLPVAGGTAHVDPSTLAADSVVYPVAVDDIGNTAAPISFSPTYIASLGTIQTSWLCDSTVSATIPALPHHAALGPVSMKTHLQDAIAAATAVDATAYLVKIVGFVVAHDGTIDLTSTALETEWDYGFMTPAQAQFPDSARGISVTYHGAWIGGANPTIDPSAGGVFEIDPITDVNGMIDSTDVATQFPCGGIGWTAHDFNDSIIYLHDTDFTGFDTINMSTADGYSWGVKADDLSTKSFGCSCPSSVTNCPAG